MLSGPALRAVDQLFAVNACESTWYNRVRIPDWTSRRKVSDSRTLFVTAV